MASESKHIAKFRDRHIKPGEEVVASGVGYIGEMMGKGKNTQQNGVLIVTGARVAFYRKGIFGEVLETIPLKAITSIERKSFMGYRSIRLHTSHDSLEFKSFNKEIDQQLADAIDSGRHGVSEAPITTTAATSGVSAMEALSKLGELKAAGILTEEEFSSKKAELLSRL